MRNRLFRAKKKVSEYTTPGWIEGFYYEVGDWAYIMEIPETEEDRLPFMERIVEKETLCQCTNLPDCNGVDIYEKDIVRCGDDVYVVEWDEEDARFVLTQEHLVENFSNISSRACEIIGNVFDDVEFEKNI